MKKLATVVVSLFILAGISAPAQATQGVAKKYSSCADLLEKYPNGVAKNKKARNKAVKGGFAKPKVSKSLYNKNNRSLDRDKDGVMCEQEETQQRAPVPVSVTPAPFDPSDSRTWSDQEKAFIRYQTEGVMRRLGESNINWYCRRMADPAYDDFTRGSYEAFAEQGLSVYPIDSSRARQMIPYYWDGWCRSLFGLSARII